jgi:hypothetical protein
MVIASADVASCRHAGRSYEGAVAGPAAIMAALELWRCAGIAQ